MVLKAAKLQMKQCMGEWRFLFHMTATTTSRFSARLTAPMMKKTGTGTSTSGQSDRFTVVAFMVSYDGVFSGLEGKTDQQGNYSYLNSNILKMLSRTCGKASSQGSIALSVRLY